MDRLPPELLHNILELGVDDDDDSLSIRERCHFLRATSLVARAWRRPSQRLLWKEMYLDGPKAVLMAERFEKAMFPTSEVHFFECYEQKHLDALVTVLSRLKGVVALRFKHVGLWKRSGLHPSVFAMPSLAGLQSLELQEVYFNPSTDPPKPSFTPSNFHLTLHHFEDLPSNLLTTARPTQLDIWFPPPFGATHEDIPNLAAIAGNVEELGLYAEFSFVPMEAFTGLKCLGMASSRFLTDYLASSVVLSVPLEGIYIKGPSSLAEWQRPDKHLLYPLINALRRDDPKLVELEMIVCAKREGLMLHLAFEEEEALAEGQEE
ncbi:hypothetical protein MNV49_001899 [Pseudohyphozyma bogoriensis]|nr:hypothetical protein MNV49_001899 [Pseudohyphozyma bogoriensis]